MKTRNVHQAVSACCWVSRTSGFIQRLSHRKLSWVQNIFRFKQNTKKLCYKLLTYGLITSVLVLIVLLR